MPSQEATILADFLLAPAALRHFLTFKQFTDILPHSYRGNPVVKELYQELQRLRQEDLEVVRSNIVEEIKRSRPLKRECTRARLRDDRAAVAGLVAPAASRPVRLVAKTLLPSALPAAVACTVSRGSVGSGSPGGAFSATSLASRPARARSLVDRKSDE